MATSSVGKAGGGIQSGTTAQGYLTPAGFAARRSPFAFLNDRNGGAQAIKAKKHSL